MNTFVNNLRIRRRESELDIFKRYFNYLSDKTGNYNTALSGRVRFDRHANFDSISVEEKFDSLPDIPESEGFYENFIWSYGGLTARSAPKNINNTQRIVWERETNRLVQVDPSVEQRTWSLANRDLLAVSYTVPSREHVGYSAISPEAGYVFRFGRELEQFVQDYTYVPGQNINGNTPPDNQDRDIRGALGEYLSTIETTGNENRIVITRLLRELFFNTPGFGNQRQDSDMNYQGVEFSAAKRLIYRDQLSGEAGFEKFVRLLTEAPIQPVPRRDDLPSNLSIDLNRDGVIDYEVVDFSKAELLVVEGSSLYAVDERPPIRRLQPYPRSAPLALAQVPQFNKLQNLSEVVYALLGSSGEGTEHPLWINYNMFKEQIRRAFGVISPGRVYDALRTVNINELEEFNQEDIGKRLIATRNTAFERDLGLSDPTITVEYYNFRPFMKPVLDYRTYRTLTDSYHFTDSEVIEATSDYATIEPHYNFYLQDYEEAISNPAVPENVLPNMYIYSFITDRDSDFAEQPTWNNPEAAAEIQGNFDKLITLGEFEATSLPSIMSQPANFLTYLQRYSAAVKSLNTFQDDSGVVIDLVSDLARQNYHITTPATEMNIYDRLNGRKKSFPMAVEASFPMAPTQLIGSLIDDTLTSTSFVNSVITAPASYEEFDATCFGLVSREQRESDTSLMAQVINDYYNIGRFVGPDAPGVEAEPAEVYRRMGARVYDFDQWMLNAQNEIEAQVQGEEGRERFTGQCPDLMDAITFEGIRNAILSEARRKMLSYEEILKEDKDLSQSETIIYKLTKDKITQDGVIQEIQNFYFPNSKKNDLVRFVDTQVKYDTEYRYSLFGIEVVYGSKFEMRVLDSNVEVDPLDVGGNEIYSIVNIKSTPNPKIIQFPLYGSPWRNISNLDPNIVGGLFYPDVKIIDRPPPPPQMLLSPLRSNYQQFLLSFQPSNESFVGDRAIPWMSLSNRDYEHTFLPSILHQKQFKNFALQNKDLEFSSESSGEIKRIEIYRSENIEQRPMSESDFYINSFIGKLHKVLDISGNPDIPLNERAIAFDCLDNVEVNKKYYYTARAVDVHGKVSNPGPVFEAEIVFQKGTYYPYINLYQPKFVKPSRPTRKMSRFLEIKAAPIQSGVKYNQNPDGNTISSQRGFVDDSSYRVENNKFLVRLTSRDTGRKIQFNISFKRDRTSEET